MGHTCLAELGFLQAARSVAFGTGESVDEIEHALHAAKNRRGAALLCSVSANRCLFFLLLLHPSKKHAATRLTTDSTTFYNQGLITSYK